MNTRPKIRDVVKKRLMCKQDYNCKCCKDILPPTYQIDHIIPFSVTHDNSEENLQVLCPNCHALKTQNEYHRIYLFKKLQSEKQVVLCWFCLYTLESTHSCDKFLKPIENKENKLRKREEKEAQIKTEKNKDISSFEIMCESFRRKEKDPLSESFSNLVLESESTLDIKIYDSYVICNNKKYKIDENLDLEFLGEIINSSTRTKKCSKKYDEINIQFVLDKSEYDISLGLKECENYLNDNLLNYIPERILKSDFIIINIEGQ